jgi:hypothetical protein
VAGFVTPTTELGVELRAAIEARGLGAIVEVEILHGGGLSRANG